MFKMKQKVKFNGNVNKAIFNISTVQGSVSFNFYFLSIKNRNKFKIISSEVHRSKIIFNKVT